MVSRMETRNLVRNLQDNYLRASVGSKKTTPTEEVALCQTPLDLAAIEAMRHSEQTKMSRRTEKYRARSYKARIPPEIPFHIKPG
jgi:hypothetical protein